MFNSILQVSTTNAERDNHFRIAHIDAIHPVITLAEDVVNWEAGRQEKSLQGKKFA